MLRQAKRSVCTTLPRRPIPASNGNEVLILGAFGCGAFCNPPEVVAKVFHDVMKDWLNRFEIIEYAVYHRPDETANYNEFARAMKEYI